MSEKISSSNPEQQPPKEYLILRSDGSLSPGYITGRREDYVSVRQRDGSMADIKRVEVRLPDTVDDEGRVLSQTKMVTEYSLGDSVQENLKAEQQKNMAKAQEITNEQFLDAENEYDQLYSDDYDESAHSVQDAAAERGVSEEERRGMRDYSVATLEGALRNDADMSSVLEVALKQDGRGIPKDRHELIELMGRSEVIKDALTRYLKVKAGYYYADLPERVRTNTPKRPNFPGGTPQPSVDVAVQYAVAMLTGEWDQSREDGEIEYDANGNVRVGQHRAAARTILMSPKMIQKEQYEQ